MIEYVERSYLRKMAKLEPLYLMETQRDIETLFRLVEDAPAANVVPAEELEKRDQEIKGLQAEVDRLHKENFWLTSEREMEPAWIAMSDKLPEEDGSYIVCTKLGAVCTATFNVKLGRWGHSMYGVTHWMRLPKPPEMGK